MNRGLIAYRLLIMLGIVFLISCSKNSVDQVQEVVEQQYLPKLISLEYGYGDTVIYELEYNSSGHIQKIRMTRNTAGDQSNFLTDFEYDEMFNPVIATTKDLSNGVSYEVSFTYDQLGIITDLIFVADGTENETSISYLPLENRYTVDGNLANYPMIWNFNNEGQLLQMGINESVLTLELSDHSKGLFNEVMVQPAIHIWYGLLFYLTSPELYFFSQQDITSVTTNEFPYLYENKVKDGGGNLISFTASYAGVLTINYVINYENRDF